MNKLVILSILVLTGCGKEYPQYLQSQGASGNDGSSGNEGEQGTPGVAGSNGHSVVFASVAATKQQCKNGGSVLLTALDVNDNLVLDSGDANLTATNICNGKNGKVKKKRNPYKIVGLIDPCGDAPGVHDEVFIKFQNGTIIASFSDSASGLNTRFSVLTPGSYVTTDGSNCHFTVTSAGNVTW